MTNFVLNQFSFIRSPYRQVKLEPTDIDMALYAERKSEEEEFWNLIVGNKDGGTMVISGEKGVGKSSFFVFQQFKCLRQNLRFPFPAIPSLKTVNLEVYDGSSARIAQDIVHTVCENIARVYTERGRKKVPEEVGRVLKWLSNEPDDSGRSISALSFSFAESVAVPSPGNSTLKNWTSVLGQLVEFSRQNLDVQGVFIGVENIDDMKWPRLLEVLSVFRETLFAVKHTWWVLIGGPSLYQRLRAEAPFITQTFVGEGLEILPISAEMLRDLIDRRVKSAYGEKDVEEAISPFTDNIIELFHIAGGGLPRYILKSADDLLLDIYRSVRKKTEDGLSPADIEELTDRDFELAFSKYYVQDQRISDRQAEIVLRERLERDFCNPHIKLTKAQYRLVTKHEGDTVSPEDGSRHGFKDNDSFEANCLVPLVKMGFLRELESNLYRFFGDAYLYRRLSNGYEGD